MSEPRLIISCESGPLGTGAMRLRDAFAQRHVPLSGALASMLERFLASRQPLLDPFWGRAFGCMAKSLGISGAVGGPSAGMMFALAVYDKITPGAMTGGQMIAGTGTMAIDGTVGPIGGITHKMVGAKEAGAGWFLAPAQDCAEVVGHVPDGLQVAKVATFDEAEWTPDPEPTPVELVVDRKSVV